MNTVSNVLAVTMLAVCACANHHAPAANHAVPAEHAVTTSITIVYGLMTYVMDSPSGQQKKAEDALRRCDVVKQLTDLGYPITYRFDDHAGDLVVISTGDGAELGRAPLIELDGKPAPAAIIDQAKALRVAK